MEASMRIAVGHSDDPRAANAAAEVLDQVKTALGGAPPLAALLYTSATTDHQTALAAIREGLPGVPLIGCTTDGECSSVMCFAEDSLVLTVFTSDRLHAVSAVGRDLSVDAELAVRSAWKQVSTRGEPSLVVVLSESIGVSGAALVRALNTVIPPGVTVVGGTAGDQWRFESTRQFHDGEILQDGVVLLAFYGPLRLSVGVASGWAPLAPRARVTRARGSSVYELDGEPALTWFRRFFGDREAPSPEHPFAVYDPPDRSDFYLRAPMLYSEEEGSIIFAADVPEGTEVQITDATRAAILGGAADAVRDAVGRFAGTATSVLVFSCAARKQVLGTRTGEEIQQLLSHESDGVSLAGFYTYGEIAALETGPTRFHNETVVAVLMGE
jgi:hypothetical protein